MPTFEEEQISMPFKVYDEQGNVVFRDALIFASSTEFRNTSQAEREAMQQSRYQSWLDLKNTPSTAGDTETPEGE